MPIELGGIDGILYQTSSVVQLIVRIEIAHQQAIFFQGSIWIHAGGQMVTRNCPHTSDRSQLPGDLLSISCMTTITLNKYANICTDACRTFAFGHWILVRHSADYAEEYVCGSWYRPKRKCLTSFPDMHLFNFRIACSFLVPHKSNTHCAWRSYSFHWTKALNQSPSSATIQYYNVIGRCKRQIDGHRRHRAHIFA